MTLTPKDDEDYFDDNDIDEQKKYIEEVLMENMTMSGNMTGGNMTTMTGDNVTMGG
ncbi:MAG TPA: hypothetical protein VKA09_02435 [Nitrososphaeraceae archaeon]|nr:hypothetical protein [Nitrososphaeraceae archaeon]